MNACEYSPHLSKATRCRNRQFEAGCYSLGVAGQLQVAVMEAGTCWCTRFKAFAKEELAK
jgi:hypothetical protein